MLLNSAKWQGYRFYRFWVIKGKPTGGQNYPPPRLGLNTKHGGLFSKALDFFSNRPWFGSHEPLAEVKLDLKTGKTSYGMFIACV